MSVQPLPAEPEHIVTEDRMLLSMEEPPEAAQEVIPAQRPRRSLADLNSSIEPVFPTVQQPSAGDKGSMLGHKNSSVGLTKQDGADTPAFVLPQGQQLANLCQLYVSSSPSNTQDTVAWHN